MFDTEAHRSYVVLMRELRLEREFEEGDWYWSEADEGRLGCYGCSELDEYHTDEMVFLPRLDQWLARLDEAGWTEVKFSADANLLFGPPLLWRVEGSGWDSREGIHLHLQFTHLRSREECCARLWAAVTGRAVGV